MFAGSWRFKSLSHYVIKCSTLQGTKEKSFLTASFCKHHTFSSHMSKSGKSCNLESFLPSVNLKLMWPDGSLTSVERLYPPGLVDGAGGPCLCVESFQIKGRDQRVVFAGVLDYTTVTLSRWRMVPEDFTHVHISQGSLHRRAAAVLRLSYMRHNFSVCLHHCCAAADQNCSRDGESNPFRWTV